MPGQTGGCRTVAGRRPKRTPFQKEESSAIAPHTSCEEPPKLPAVKGTEWEIGLNKSRKSLPFDQHVVTIESDPLVRGPSAPMMSPAKRQKNIMLTNQGQIGKMGTNNKTIRITQPSSMSCCRSPACTRAQLGGGESQEKSDWGFTMHKVC